MPSKKEEEPWELSDIPSLLDIIVKMNQRLIDEQYNATVLLNSCRRGHYWDYYDIEVERDRLRDNIEKCRQRRNDFQELLLEFAKGQAKKDES